MVECRFTLELTKNGIQKSVYAKAGEINGRKLIITLTQNGKVYDLTKCSAIIFLENGDNFGANIVGDSVQAIIPNAFPEPQIRICELRLSYNNSESVLYSPMFELVFEESLGNKAEKGETLVNGVQNVKKSEHDKDDSHTIAMVSGLQEQLDKTASKEKVELLETEIANVESRTKSYTDTGFSTLDGKIDTVNSTLDGKMDTEFAKRDKNLNDFAKQTNQYISNLDSFDRTISEEVNSLDERVDENKNNIKLLQNRLHSHRNKESVLDKLSTSQSGKLTFDGKPVQSESNVSGGRPYDTLACYSTLMALQSFDDSKKILGVYDDLGLHGVEIKTIRVQTSEFGMVDLRFMSDVPGVQNNNPYIINFCTLNASELGFLATLAIVDFLGGGDNSIVEAIVNYDVNYFEIDYYTDN